MLGAGEAGAFSEETSDKRTEKAISRHEHRRGVANTKVAIKEDKYQKREEIETSNSFTVLDDVGVVTTGRTEGLEMEGEKEEKKPRNKWKPGDLILNLSRKQLTAHEEEVLKKGIKFSPYPKKVNMYQYIQEMMWGW